MTEISFLPVAAAAQPILAEETGGDDAPGAWLFSVEEVPSSEDAEQPLPQPEAKATTLDPLQSLLEDLCGISSTIAPGAAAPASAAVPAATAPSEGAEPPLPALDLLNSPVENQSGIGTAPVPAIRIKTTSLPGDTAAEAPQADLAVAELGTVDMTSDASLPMPDASGDKTPPAARQIPPVATASALAAAPTARTLGSAEPPAKGAASDVLAVPQAEPGMGMEFLLVSPERSARAIDASVPDPLGASFLMASGPDGAVSAQATGPRPVAMPVARQMAQALVSARDELVEIALAPEELGRIRMIVTGSDQAPHIKVFVERPEVLEQLRRNAAFLQECFRDAGMAGASFEFSGGGQFESPDDRPVARDHGPSDLPMAEMPDAVPAAWIPTLVPTRLDIRI